MTSRKDLVPLSFLMIHRTLAENGIESRSLRTPLDILVMTITLLLMIPRLTLNNLCSTKCFVVSVMLWFSPDEFQVPTKTALSLPLLSWTGERKYDERLMSRDKDRERSLTSYCHGQKTLNLGRKKS